MDFSGRTLVIATQHGKESVIAPLLEKEWGVKAFLPTNFDTDILGTFSGEIERKSDPISTAKQKCLLAMEESNCDLAVASEGSFGPHPQLYFAHANEEILFLFDRRSGLELISKHLTTETNFNGKWIKNVPELKVFAENALFPSHGLILREQKDGKNDIQKGISDWENLHSKFLEYIDNYGGAYVETDMRACFNPTRMMAIQEASKKLVQLMASKCPSCHYPGYTVAEVQDGLPCSLCACPTRSTLAYIYRCTSCKHQETQIFPHQKQTEDPMYCDRCNP